jgi:hypothetical protein
MEGQMKKLIEKFIYNSQSSGLLLVDMPTGLGKSTNVRKFIKDYINNSENKKKILYITGLKKNLEEEKFRKEFGNDVLFLNNNTDTLIENYTKVKDRLPKQIYSNRLTKRLESLINTINTTSDYNLKNEARNIISEDIEKEFRGLLENIINVDAKTGKKLSLSAKKKLIKTEEFSWIADLYPAVLTDEKRIILMSMDKFLARNSTIIEPSYTIFNSKLVEDSILFIDEFDATKDIALKNIIKTGLLNRINIIDLFRLINDGFTNTQFTSQLIEESEKFKKDKEKNSKLKTPKIILDELKKEVAIIYEKYYLSYFQKLDESLKSNEAFLFHDYTFKSILKENEKLIKYDIDKDNQVVWIEGVDAKAQLKNPTNKDKEEDINIINMLFDIKRIINYFKNCVYIIAINYLNKKNEKNRLNIYNHYKLEAAIKTVLAEFCIEGSYANFIYELISPRLVINQLKSDNEEDKLDFSIYQQGFSYYMFMDNDLYDTQSKIQYYSYHNTPEKILLELSRQTKVVGISATSTLPNVISNYDIEYLKTKLGKNLILSDEDDKKRITNHFKRYSLNYKNVNICVNAIDINKENYNNFIYEFGLNTQKQINELFNKLDVQFPSIDYYKNNNFAKIRYLKLFKVYQSFLNNKEIKSLIFLTNRSLKKQYNDIFNIDDAQLIFDTIKQEMNIDNVFEKSLYGDPENFKNHKNEIMEKLKNGEKGFIISSYQTLGAGQNIQYEIPSDLKEDLVQVNDFDYHDNSKDFDSIFLDRPTNVFARTSNESNYGISKDEMLAKHIFQLKFLEEVGDIEPKDVENAVKNAFKQTYLSGGYNDKNPDCMNLKVASAKIIQQAIGRICRTKNKSKNIYIFYDKELEMDLSSLSYIYKDKLLNKEYEELLDKLLDKEYVPNFYENLKNIALKNVLSSASYIKNLRKWNYSNIKEWENIREFVLKYPITNNLDNKYNFLYLKLPYLKTFYHAEFKNHDNPDKIIFDADFNSVIGEKYSYDRANLNSILKISGVRSFFNANNYKTFFDACEYMLHPLAFDSLYKGALGEVVGKFVIEKELGKKLNSITDIDLYEKFDFYYKDVFIDFKNRNQDSKHPDIDFNNIRKKLNKCNGRIALIINIIKPNTENNADFKIHYEGSNIVVVPYLYDSKGNKNNKAFIKINEILN